jgi:DHA2 family multidrug resistance protein-like MFS transporter
MLGSARLTGQSCAAVLVAMMFGVFGAHGRGTLLTLALAAAAATAGCVFSLLRVRHVAGAGGRHGQAPRRAGGV